MSVASHGPEATTNDSPGKGGLPGLRERRLLPLLSTLVLSAVVLFLFWSALSSVFLALQVKQLDPDGAAGGLAKVLAVGAIGALVSAPLAGALSDRTRTRIGGRGPWMLAGAVVTLVLAVLIGRASSTTELMVYWTLVQASTNFIFTPLLVHIPERVPLARRGTFSAGLGLSHLAGMLLGSAVGAAFAKRLVVGYLVVSVLLVIAVAVFVMVNRRSNIGAPTPAFRLVPLLKTFWVNPIKHPAFGLVFLGRFLFMTGFFPTTVYLLYVLQDYLGLGEAAVARMPAISLASLVGSLIGTPLAGWLTDRLGATRPLIYLSSAIMVVAFVLPLVFPTFIGLLAYSFLIGLGFASFGAVDYVLITKVLPSQDDAGKDLGIINMTTTLSQTLGVGVAGALIGAVGSYAVLFPLGIVLVSLSAVCVMLIRNVR